MTGNDVLIEHSDYKAFRIKTFLQFPETTYAHQIKKGHLCGGPLTYRLFLWYRKIFTLLVVGSPRFVLAP